MKSDEAPPYSPAGLVLTSESEARTGAIGRVIGAVLRPGDVLLLAGELGAGKTRLVQGVAEGLGVRGHVRSPSFVLVSEYQGRMRLSHCDLYRVAGPDEVAELALDERLRDGALAVEWPERGGDALPPDGLLVQIEVDAESGVRTLVMTPRGPRGARLLARASAAMEALSAAEGARPTQA